MSTLLDDVREHLVDAGIVRIPRVPGSAPPMWIEPRLGVPAPGESPNDIAAEKDANIVVGLFRAPGIAPAPYEGFRETSGVELRFRATSEKPAYALHSAIRGSINDRRQLDLNGRLVNQVLLFRDFHRLGSDESSSDFAAEYLIEEWANSLVGG
jgi:hypothetical protein